VVPLDRGEQRRHFGTNLEVWLWILGVAGGSGGKGRKIVLKFPDYRLRRLGCSGGAMGGSGCVGVVPLDRGEQRGHFGANLEVWLWILGVAGGSQDNGRKRNSKILGFDFAAAGVRWRRGGGSGCMAVVPLDRREQRGHFGTNLGM
jgi:hypothetical protein